MIVLDRHVSMTKVVKYENKYSPIYGKCYIHILLSSFVCDGFEQQHLFGAIYLNCGGIIIILLLSIGAIGVIRIV
jgi:hypothetical protein